MQYIYSFQSSDSDFWNLKLITYIYNSTLKLLKELIHNRWFISFVLIEFKCNFFP